MKQLRPQKHSMPGRAAVSAASRSPRLMGVAAAASAQRSSPPLHPEHAANANAASATAPALPVNMLQQVVVTASVAAHTNWR